MAQPGTINHVYGEFYGCFVACVAMVMGKTYREAFEAVHPGRDIHHHHGGGIAPNAAFDRLGALGLKPRLIPASTDITKLKKTCIIWVRWASGEELMHSVVYEHATRKFWDPGYSFPLTAPHQLRNINRLKETIVALDGYVAPIRVAPAYPESPFITSNSYYSSEYDY